MMLNKSTRTTKRKRNLRRSVQLPVRPPRNLDPGIQEILGGCCSLVSNRKCSQRQDDLQAQDGWEIRVVKTRGNVMEPPKDQDNQLSMILRAQSLNSRYDVSLKPFRKHARLQDSGIGCHESSKAS